ncbi:MAG: rod-binding protein [Pseudomonadota bacterium]
MTEIAPLPATTAPASANAKTISPQRMAEIERTAKDFEAVFLAEMLKPMVEGVEVSEDFGGGRGEEVFRGMMVDEYGKIMSNKGGIGLADHVKAQMIRLELGQDPNTPAPSAAAYQQSVRQAAEISATPAIQESLNVTF